MQNTELSDIESSMTALVRRAFEAGRNDVLKRVVDVLKTDQTAPNLALTGPQHDAGHASREQPTPRLEALSGPETGDSVTADTGGDPVSADRQPWWARPIR